MSNISIYLAAHIKKDVDGTTFKEMSQKMVKLFIRHMQTAFEMRIDLQQLKIFDQGKSKQVVSFYKQNNLVCDSK